MKAKYRVLIADDVPEMRTYLKKIIEPLGCVVAAEAEDGNSAIQQIITMHPDIVFLDIDMPLKSGLDVLIEIQQMKLNVFTVIVSGHSTIDNVKEAIQMGAKGFVVKPYSSDKIVQILKKYNMQNN